MSEVVGEGDDGLDAQIEQLRGLPVVIEISKGLEGVEVPELDEALIAEIRKVAEVYFCELYDENEGLTLLPEEDSQVTLTVEYFSAITGEISGYVSFATEELGGVSVPYEISSAPKIL
ncbi:hypothetical protein KKG71_02950 [Patescibacteria group bacterium]|nr:hypothetical protein [Patescibacteria group bacterium]